MVASEEVIGGRVRNLETIEETQTGNGAPAHTAADGTNYWDNTNAALYINDSGAGTFGNSWQHIGGGGVAVPHTLLNNPWHTDTATQAPTRGSLVYGDATPVWNELVHPGAANRVFQSTIADVQWSANQLILNANLTVTTATTLVGGGNTLTLAANLTNNGGAANQVAYWSALNTLAGENQLALSRGGTGADLSATGGANQYVQQAGVGAAFTVGPIAAAAIAHNVLDGSVHSDSAADAVTRGSLIYGNSTPLWDELVIGAGGTILYSDGADPSWSTLAAAGIAPNNAQYLVNAADATLTNEVVVTAARGALIIGNAVPSWAVTAHPGGAGYALTTDANDTVWDQTPTWTGLHTFGAGWELSGGDADLNALALYFDADRDTYMQSAIDDSIAIFIGGLWDFNFSANEFSVLSGSHIEMADDTWIGLGAAAGRLVFDSTPAPDQIEVTTADLNFVTTAHGIIHVDGVANGEILLANGTRYVPSGWFLAGTAARTYTFGTAGGTITTSAGTLTAATPNNVTAAGVQTHAITNTSDGATNHSTILSSSAAGALTMDDYFTVDGGTFGITGNELLTVNAAGTFAFSGISGVSVEDGDWIGAGAGCAWLYDSGNGDISTTAYVGIGTTAPDGTCHVHTATAGAVAPHANYDDLTVENSAHGGMSILVPDSQNAAIAFGSPSDSIGAIVRWNFNNALFQVGSSSAGGEVAILTANAVEAIRIDSNGNVGIGTAAPGNVHLYVYDNTLTSMATFSGIYSYHIKTGGAGAAGDDYHGINSYMSLNQSTTIDQLYGGRLQSHAAAGTVGTQWGSRGMTQVVGGTVSGSSIGSEGWVDIDSGTVGYAIGVRAYVDIEAASTITNGVYGVYVYIDDDDNSVTSYMVYLNAASNVDWGFYESTTEPNYLAGALGIGYSTPSLTTVHLGIYDNAVSTTTTYYGIYNYHQKTAGATDAADSFYGVYNYTEYDDVGSTIGNIYGIRDLTYAIAGTATNVHALSVFAYINGMTVSTNAYGILSSASLNTGTVSGDLFGAQILVDAAAAATLTGDMYGIYLQIDDDAGGGTVYSIYWDEQNGVDYGLYQAGTATNELGGDLIPTNPKGQDLGGAANEWDNIYYVTANTGTSRLVDSTRDCPVCGERMKRGTGTLYIMGEDADYAIAFCVNCGNVATEEHNHLPSGYKSRRRTPSKVIVSDIRVKSSGRHREVAIDFDYGDGVKNSTRLGEDELARFLQMSDNERETFLHDLGVREWESREENRLMKEHAMTLEDSLNSISSKFIGRNLV